MPAQTVMQVRRDTAANWSSANPVLANGEMGYDTTNKLFKLGDGSTAWNSLKVMAQHDTGSAARPLLTQGAYLSGSGLVLSGLSGNYASAPDSAALSITGDIDIKVKVALTDWTPGTQQTLVDKWLTTGDQRSYHFSVTTNGNLALAVSPSGTSAGSLTITSTSATGFSDGATKWIRGTIDVNDGAGNRVTKFYTSDDGSSWTQLGTTVTTAGTTSIFDSTATLSVGGFGTGTFTTGTIYRTIIQSAYDTADNTTSLQFDANFETQTADALAFTESSSNTATVTINTTRYSYGVPGAQWQTVGTLTPNANTDYYEPFTVNRSAIVDMFGFEVTTAPASTSTVQMAIYATDDDFQPTGSPIATASTTVANTFTGVNRTQITPVTLQPGNYVVAYNLSVAFATRSVRGGVSAMAGPMGASPLDITYTVSRTNAAFTGSPSRWNTRGTSSVGFIHTVHLRWKAAS